MRIAQVASPQLMRDEAYITCSRTAGGFWRYRRRCVCARRTHARAGLLQVGSPPLPSPLRLSAKRGPQAKLHRERAKKPIVNRGGYT